MLASEELKTFLAVVRAGSLLKAAEVVHASQSTVSYRIQQLEKQLGFQVLQRTRGTRAIALTEDGGKLLALAEAWESLNNDIDRLRYQDDIQVALGFADVLANYLFQGFFTALAKRTPAVRFDIETGRSWDLAERVATGRLDAAFTVFEVESQTLEAVKIADYQLLPIASPELAQLLKRGDEEIMLHPEREILLDWGPGYDLWRHENGLSRALSKVDKAQHLLALMKHSCTWSTVPELMVSQMEEVGCRVIEGQTQPPPMGVYRIQRRTKLPGTTRQADLIDSLLRESLGT
jgi:DNA-binding transcriptional LysR family regulator